MSNAAYPPAREFQTVIVTGAASGIGLACVEACLRQGTGCAEWT